MHLFLTKIAPRDVKPRVNRILIPRLRIQPEEKKFLCFFWIIHREHSEYGSCTREDFKARCAAIDQNWEYVHFFNNASCSLFPFLWSSVFSPFFAICILIEKSRNGELVRFNIFLIFLSLAIFFCPIVWLAVRILSLYIFPFEILFFFFSCKWIDLNRCNWFEVLQF